MLPLFWFVLLRKLARLNIFFALCLDTDLSFMSCTLESLHCFNIPRVTWSSLKLSRVGRAGNIYRLLKREKSKVLAVSLSVFPPKSSSSGKTRTWTKMLLSSCKQQFKELASSWLERVLIIFLKQGVNSAQVLPILNQALRGIKFKHLLSCFLSLIPSSWNKLCSLTISLKDLLCSKNLGRIYDFEVVLLP